MFIFTLTLLSAAALENITLRVEQCAGPPPVIYFTARWGSGIGPRETFSTNQHACPKAGFKGEGRVVRSFSDET